MTEVTVDHLIERLRRFRDERNWSQFHTPKDLAISVSVEAAELLELFQWRLQSEIPDATLKEGVEAEIADVFLYLLLLCDRMSIDLLKAANDKLLRNEARFPVASSYDIPKPKDMSNDQ